MPFEFEDQVSELIAELDYSGRGGSSWHMLKHAERHGFDLAVLKPYLHAEITRIWRSDMPLGNEEVREIVLLLRDRMRLEAFMSPLSEVERSKWRWADIAPSRRYQYIGPQVMDETKKMTHAQTQAAASCLHDCYPEAVHYLRLVRDHNAPLGFNGGRYDKYIVRQAWHRPFLEDAVCEIVGEQGDLFVARHEIEWIVAPRLA